MPKWEGLLLAMITDRAVMKGSRPGTWRLPLARVALMDDLSDDQRDGDDDFLQGLEEDGGGAKRRKMGRSKKTEQAATGGVRTREFTPPIPLDYLSHFGL